MKRASESWPVFSANAYESQINPRPPYQRGPVWSVTHQQLFIDSMLRGYDIPKLYLRETNTDGYTWEVIDGQQRLKAIWDYFAGRFPLSRDSDPVESHSVAGVKYGKLPPSLINLLNNYQLSVVIIDKATDDEIEDMFIRLQNGVPLNTAERRHAISGQMRDFVQNLAENHPFTTTSLGFANKRYAHEEIIAQMLLIERQKAPTPIRHTQLQALYEQNKQFNAQSPEASQLKRVLAFLHVMFPERNPDLNKVNSISLYTLLTTSLGKYVLTDRESDIRQWFDDFQNRRAVDDELSEDERDPTLMSYQFAVTRQSADIASQEIRLRILLDDMTAHITDLQQLDGQRLFSPEQRAAIFRLAERKCANPFGNPDCDIECSANNYHADHIVPYSKGGPTSVSNGQLLCPSCNVKKGASYED